MCECWVWPLIYIHKTTLRATGKNNFTWQSRLLSVALYWSVNFANYSRILEKCNNNENNRKINGPLSNCIHCYCTIGTVQHQVKSLYCHLNHIQVMLYINWCTINYLPHYQNCSQKLYVTFCLSCRNKIKQTVLMWNAFIVNPNNVISVTK